MKLIYDKDLGAWIDNWFTKHRYYHPHSRSTSIPISELKDIVEQMPSADAVPVVRCKDCKWWEQIDDGQYGYCSPRKYGFYKDDWFCKDGERRTE